MKKLIYSTFLIVLAIISACSTELDVTAPYRTIPVVYGVLNPSDTFQYIAVYKGFVSENGNAITIAQNPDSTHYKPEDIKAYLVQRLNNKNDSILLDTTTVIISKTDKPRSIPRPVYKTPLGFKLNKSASYGFALKLNNKEIASSATLLISDITPITNSTTNGLLLHNGSNYASQDYQTNIPKNAGRYEVSLRFFYTEKNKTTGDSVQKHLDWYVGTGGRSSSEVNYRINGTGFYSYLRANIEVNPNFERTASSIVQVTFSATTADLAKYIELSAPNNSLNETPPDFTNILNGKGIFASQASVITSKNLNVSSMNELKNGKITGSLGFK